MHLNIKKISHFSKKNLSGHNDVNTHSVAFELTFSGVTHSFSIPTERLKKYIYYKNIYIKEKNSEKGEQLTQQSNLRRGR